MFCAIDHSGKMPSVCRSPATTATEPSTVVSPRDPSKTRSSISVWPCPARPASPTISPSWATRPSSRRPAAGARPGPAGPRDRGSTRRARVAVSGMWPIAVTSESRSNAAAWSIGDDEAVAHDDDAVGGGRISPSRCEMRIVQPPSAEKRRTNARSCPRDDGVEAGGRLIEDDEPCRRVGDREGPGDLDHLPLGERQVADDLARRDAVAREDRVERVADEGAGLADASAGRAARGWMMRAFSATVRLGQSESSWKTQRTPEACAAPTEYPADRSSPAISMTPASGASDPGEHVHERGLAGAVVADEADALAGIDAQVDAAERTHGPEGFSTPSSRTMGGSLKPAAVRRRRPLRSPSGRPRACTPSRRRRAHRREAASKLSWSLRRYGTTMSCGTSSPASSCWATQKAGVAMPGAIETDIVS